MPVALGVNGGVLGSNNLPSSGSAKGIWTPNEIARAVALGFWPVNYARSITETATGADVISTGANADPYFNLTTLLLSTTATNGQQNNTFQDSSTNNFTITRNGNTTQGTFSPFSQTGWSNYFSSANISCPNINFSTNAFCIEGWFYFTDVTTQNINLWGTTSGSGSQPKMNLVANYQYNSNLLNFDVGSFGTNPLSASMSYINNNAWNHIAIVREGTGTNQAKMYINGTARSTGTFSGNCSTITGVFNICYMGEALGIKFPGWVSNFRIVNGSPVYTADFTPSTTPLTAITNTVLLTCQANRFVDSNTQVAAKTITLTGTPTVVPFSPFNPTSAWSASTVGGSGYFDGTGDYLTTPDNAAFNLGSSDFLIETWVYNQSTTNFKMVMGQWNTGQVSYTLRQNASKWVFTYTTNGTTEVAVTGTSNQVLNAWTHLAVIRTGNTLGLFVNGTRETTASMTGVTIHNNTGVFSVGGAGNGGDLYVGYIGSSRLVLGTLPSGYDATQSTLTLPTAPFTSTASTSILLNFTNSGIYDATAKNVLETVGNAQVSTAQSKWSPTSMYFDGTGDWLDSLASNQLFNLSSGNWTIEAWIYRNVSGAAHTILNLYNTAGSNSGLTFYVNASNQLVTDNGATAALAAGTVASGQWVYVAIVRSGSTTTGYINGSSVGTTAQAPSASQYARVGALATGAYTFNGYIQNLRITKGYARTITTPTAAFPVQ